MARVRSPLFSLEARGSVSDLQFQTRKGRCVAGESSKARQPDTAKQLRARDAFIHAQAAYEATWAADPSQLQAVWGPAADCRALWVANWLRMLAFGDLFNHELMPFALCDFMPWIPDPPTFAVPSLQLVPDGTPATFINIEGYANADNNLYLFVKRKSYFGCRRSCDPSKLLNFWVWGPDYVTPGFDLGTAYPTEFIDVLIWHQALGEIVNTTRWAFYNGREMVRL